MKKIFIGGAIACGVHNEKNELIDYISIDDNLELVYDYKEADLIIVIDTCMGTYLNLEESINYLNDVLLNKKSGAMVIVSGCLTKGLKFKLDEKYQNILSQVIQVQSSEIVAYVINLLKINIDEDIQRSLNLKIPAISFLDHSIQFSPVEGCLNHCGFCKTNYMNFVLQSTPLENIELITQDIIELEDKMPINYLRIHSSNFSLYGVDLYKTPKAHEVLKILSTPDIVKFISCGALINLYKDLVYEILSNPKIKHIFISLESGSDRVYKLMNRPISLVKLIEIIKLIRSNRPDIIIDTELICGFPTETKDDLDRTIDLIYELDINPLFGHPYINSSQIPSSKLPQQSYEYGVDLFKYSKRRLAEQINRYSNIINNSELIVIDKNPYMRMYKVMLVNGKVRYIGYDQFDKEYNINDLISANSSNKSRVLKKRV